MSNAGHRIFIHEGDTTTDVNKLRSRSSLVAVSRGCVSRISHMKRAYYSRNIPDFLTDDPDTILGQLARQSEFAVEQSQRDAWLAQIEGLKQALVGQPGTIYFEYAIPRMGKRVDVVLVIGPAIFVVEYKVGEDRYSSNAIDQVTDYALDLKHFHESSHERHIAPILIATHAPGVPVSVALTQHKDKLFSPIRSNGQSLGEIIREVHAFIGDVPSIDGASWIQGSYRPTPTIIEAATALLSHQTQADRPRSVPQSKTARRW